MGDELDAIFDQAHGNVSSGDSYDPLDAIFDKAHGNKAPEPWSVGGSIKHTLTGGTEGILDYLALVADFSPVGPGAFGARAPVVSPAMKTAERALLSAEEPNFKLERNVGRFTGPALITGPGGWVTRALSGAGGGAGYTLGEELTEGRDDFWSRALPIALSIAGSVGPQVLSDAGKSLYGLLRRPTPEQVKGSAAKAFQETTQLKPEVLEQAIAANSDELGKLRTTAEITDNVGAAQLEKNLASSGPAAQQYAERSIARDAARAKIIDSGSSVEGINPESLGSDLINKGSSVLDDLSTNSEKLWKAVPRNVPIDVTEGQAAIRSIIYSKQAGLEPGSKVKTLVTQFLNPKGKSYGLLENKPANALNSGALQDIRSDALKLLRDQDLSPLETRLLGALQGKIDEAMESGLTGSAYDAWQQARAATAKQAETFQRGTAGGYLVDDYARPANVLGRVFRGDKESVKELKAAIGNDPILLEKVKRSIIDSVPRTQTTNRLTPAGVSKFLKANENGLRELFGDGYVNSLRKVVSDLQSEAGVSEKLAFSASRGNSVTAQRGTVAAAVNDIIMGSLLPGSGPLAKIAEAVRQSVGNKSSEAVQDLIFGAAMDPKFALELAKAPTATRIYTALEHVQNAALNAGKVTGRSAISATADLQQKSQGRAKGDWSQNQIQTPQLPRSATPTSSAAPQAKNQSQPSIFSKQQSIFQKNISSPSVFTKLSKAVEKVESGGKADAVSKAGAIGLMQVKPDAARDVLRANNIDDSDITDAELAERLKDPDFNKQIGDGYLSILIEKYGDLELALAAYNAGLGRVDKLIKTHGKDFDDIKPHLPEETRNYVPKVKSIFEKVA